MIGKKKRNISRAGTVLLILAGAVLAVSIYFDSQLTVTPLSRNQNLVLQDHWSIYEGEELIASDISLPYHIQGDVNGKTYTVTTTLPEEFPLYPASFSIETSLSTLDILLDGKTIYTYSAQGTAWKKPVLGGGYTHFVDLPDWAPSHELSMVMTIYSNSPFAGGIHIPEIGSRADQILYQLRELPSLAVGFIFLFTGVVSMLVSLFLNKGKERQSVFYFGMLILALGLWVATQNCAKVIILRNSVLPLNLSYIALFMLPYILTKYIQSSYEVVERIIDPFLFISYLFLAAFIAGGAGQYFGWFNYADTLLYAGMGLILFILSISLVLLRDFFKGNRDLSSFLIAVAVLLFTVISEEVLLMMSISLENASILHAGMGLCGIILLSHSARVVSQGRKNTLREQMLQNLAYTDSLTGIGNRTLYEIKVDDIQSGEESQRVIGIIIIDVNNLKPINDEQGHAVGDAVLKHAALMISESLPSESEVFRVGGG